ncbi:Resolvase-like protein [Bosea sp. LC85]|uniref:recombinase family protein n=1 Tax=Bosea sp. LC85 TaxID=1502851 RepID=UPI0004E30479|nr:recombinase family protein [Bosea sp. LC85]KFC75623.1 Resolvase-like protein [Bosea sp. LC85]
MADGDYVAYYRVSTARQGASGLGLEAQHAAVEAYLNGGAWRILGEFTEVESGRKSERPELHKALHKARLHRVPLIVAKVDRLTRSKGFLERLLESGVDVRFCDIPKIEGATGRFLLQQMAAVAELEAGLISTRTKAALAAAKERRKKKELPPLGGNRGVKLTQAAQEAGRAAQTARATARNHDLAPVIEELRTAGITSLAGLAEALTSRGIPTARGKAQWAPVQVARVLERLEAGRRLNGSGRRITARRLTSCLTHSELL